MKASTLFFVGIAFACGFLFGFSYHHIVDDAHEDTTAARGHAPRPEATESQWQRFEARLKALEAARAREAEAKEEAKVPTPSLATLPTPSLAKPLTKRQMTNLLHAKPKRAASAAPGAKCKPGRKPYHLLLTAQDSPYQAWQTWVRLGLGLGLANLTLTLALTLTRRGRRASCTTTSSSCRRPTRASP